MDWSDTQLAEIRYFCTSTRSRTPKILVGLPLKFQLGFILIIFSHYQVTEFQSSDIKAFYKLLYTPHFRPDQLRAPSPARIAKALEKLDKEPKCQINVQCCLFYTFPSPRGRQKYRMPAFVWKKKK